MYCMYNSVISSSSPQSSVFSNHLCCVLDVNNSVLFNVLVSPECLFSFFIIIYSKSLNLWFQRTVIYILVCILYKYCTIRVYTTYYLLRSILYIHTRIQRERYSYSTFSCEKIIILYKKARLDRVANTRNSRKAGVLRVSTALEAKEKR